ncbi:MAG: hypothetical protein LBB94_08795 [Clostridiales bacterium]|jgi:enterochelin esterase-like enzyme|nr:hypothetical protein [Clostridiales bacterium]
MTDILRVNAALTETADAFDPQLPMGGGFAGGKTIPSGIEYTGGGKAVLRFYAPSASSVDVRLGYPEGPAFGMERRTDGVWAVTLSVDSLEHAGDRYTAIFFEVDGVYVLNPMAPIGWSHAHPINILDFPGEGYYLVKEVPHGAVARDYYFSKTCACFKSCLVYTPPGYSSGKWDKLPVLYLQHGYGENETSWIHLGKVNWIMDNLLAEGKAEPCIIVMNNGMTQTAGSDGVWGWDSLIIEKLLLEDCIPHIERHYRAASDKWHRAMAGLSMGSAQTSVTTLKHPDLFGYAGIFSGFLGVPRNQQNVRNEHFSAFEDRAKLLESYKLFFRCIGEADQFLERYNNESAMLDGKGLSPNEWPAHVQATYPGGHDWNVWRPCVRDFLSLAFKA